MQAEAVTATEKAASEQVVNKLNDRDIGRAIIRATS